MWDGNRRRSTERFEELAHFAFGVVVATMVEVSHIDNVRRLIAGEEPKLGQGGSRRQQPET